MVNSVCGSPACSRKTKHSIRGISREYILVSNFVSHAQLAAHILPHAELAADISIMMFSKILPSLFVHFKSYTEKKQLHTHSIQVCPACVNSLCNLLSEAYLATKREKKKTNVHCIYGLYDLLRIPNYSYLLGLCLVVRLFIFVNCCLYLAEML